MTERTLRRWMGVAAAAMVAASVVVTQAQQQSPRQLFERARVLEENSRTLNQAVDLYQQVVKQAKTDRALAASAQLRIGLVQERQGKPEARTVFANIVRDYKDQPSIVTTARTRLSAAPGAAQLELTPRRVFDGAFETVLDMSVDGRFTVGSERERYNSGPGTGAGLILRDVQTGLTRRLGPAFQARLSRDGQRVAMGCNDQGKTWLCIVGTAAGSIPALIVESARPREVEPLDWSPDGRSLLVLVRLYNEPNGGVRSLELGWLSIEGKGIRTIKVFESGLAPNPQLLRSRVSPDGQFVAFLMRPQRDQEPSLYTIDITGQNESRIVTSAGPNDYPLWTPDGGTLLFTGEVAGHAGLFSVAVRGGKAVAEPVLQQRESGFVNGGGSFFLRPLVITASGSLYYTRTAGNLNYEFVVNRPSSASNGIVSFSGIHGSWSSQGLLAFLRETGDDADLIVRDMASGIETRYQQKGMDFGRELRWLPDGSGVIVFVNEDTDERPDAVYMLDMATKKFRRLIDVHGEGWWRKAGGVSPDSKTLYFSVSDAAIGPVNRIVAVEIATGDERTVTTFESIGRRASGAEIDVSPDGRTLAVSVSVDSLATNRLFTVGVDGTSFREVVASFPTGWNNLRWTPDGRSIAFVGSNPDTTWRIMRVPAAGGEPVFDGLDEHALQALLPDIKLFPGNFNGFDFSPDGSKILPSQWTMAKYELWTIDGLLTAVNSR